MEGILLSLSVLNDIVVDKFEMLNLEMYGSTAFDGIFRFPRKSHS
jgi:hypothetical protein